MKNPLTELTFSPAGEHFKRLTVICFDYGRMFDSARLNLESLKYNLENVNKFLGYHGNLNDRKMREF